MMKRNMLALLTTIIMVFLFSGAVLAQDGQGTVLISGNMSDTISWQLDSEGTLSFSGSGVIQSTSAWGKTTSDAEFTSKYVPMVKKLVVEEGITKIEELFHLTFPNLKEIWLPDHFTSIGSRVFANNTSLESVHFGSDTCDLSYIGTSAFYKCPSLKEVYYPLTVGSWNLIDIDCFNGDLRKAASSAGIPISGEGAWGDITWKVEETTDGVQLTLSGNGAVPKMSTSFCTTGEAVTAWHQFRDVITDVVIESKTADEGITSLSGGNGLFNTTSESFLTNPVRTVTFTGDAPVIDQYSFYGLKGATIYYPEGNSTWTKETDHDGEVYAVTSRNYGGKDLIWQGTQSGLHASGTSIVEEGGTGNRHYAYWTLDWDGVLTVWGEDDDPLAVSISSRDMGEYTDFVRKLVVQDGVSALYYGSSSESNCFPNLTTAELGAAHDLKSIDLLEGCEKLENVVFPEEMTRIPQDMLRNCTALTQIRLPDTVTAIEPRAFLNCTSLWEILLPFSLREIGVEAFRGCSNLHMAHYPRTENDWHSMVAIDDWNGPLLRSVVDSCGFQLGESGMWGDVVWTLSQTIANGTTHFVLTFKNSEGGDGRIPEKREQTYIYNGLGESVMPWHAYRDIITDFIVEEDITYVPAQCFSCGNSGDISPQRIVFKGNVPSGGISANAFDGCRSTSLFYKGTLSEWNALYPYSLDESITLYCVGLAKNSYEYTGKEIEPEICIWQRGSLMENPKDICVVSASDNTMPGTASVELTFPNYEGLSMVFPFTILPKNAESAVIDPINACQYTGEPLTPALYIVLDGTELVAEKDYQAVYRDNIEAGTAHIDISYIGGYTGSASAEFTIIGRDISQVAEVSFAEDTGDLIYDGAAKEPAVTVSLMGNKLTKGTDYSVTYQNNVNAGEASAVVLFTGVGAYEGSRMLLFTIKKAAYDMSGVSFPGHTYENVNQVPISLEIEGQLPEGVSVRYEGNGQTEPGEYDVTAYFEGDEINHEPIASMNAKLMISTGQGCDHVFERATVKEPTCTEGGVIRDVCRYCGAEGTVPEDYIPMLGHDFGGAVFTWEKDGSQITVYDQGGNPHVYDNMTATAVRKCSRCLMSESIGAHQSQEPSYVEPTLEYEGKITFYADAVFDPGTNDTVIYSDSHEMILPKLEPPELADLSWYEEKLAQFPDTDELVALGYSQETVRLISEARAILKQAQDEKWDVTYEGALDTLKRMIQDAETGVLMDDWSAGNEALELYRELKYLNTEFLSEPTRTSVESQLASAEELLAQYGDPSTLEPASLPRTVSIEVKEKMISARQAAREDTAARLEAVLAMQQNADEYSGNTMTYVGYVAAAATGMDLSEVSVTNMNYLLSQILEVEAAVEQDKVDAKAKAQELIEQINALDESTCSVPADADDAVKAAADAARDAVRVAKEAVGDADPSAMSLSELNALIRDLTYHTSTVETQKQNLETAKQEAQAAAEQKAIEEVRQAVNALKENAGTADEEAVRQARELYDALSEEQKEQLGSAVSGKLEAAESSVAKAKEEERKAQEATEKEEQEREQQEKEQGEKDQTEKERQEKEQEAKETAEKAAKEKAAKEKAEKEKKAAAAKKLAEAQAAFMLNVKDGAKKLPIQVKKKNKKIKAVTLAAGDSLASAVSDHPENVSASVSGKTVVLNGRKVKGKATITVRTKYGAVRKFSVVVQKKKVKTKKIAVKKKLKLKVGTRYALTNVVVPVTTTDKLTFQSSNKKIASVNKKTGLIKAKKPGKVKITIKSGKKKKVIRVTVKK